MHNISKEVQCIVNIWKFGANWSQNRGWPMLCRPGLCLSEQESANSFEFCKSLRCKSPVHCLVQSYSDFLNSVHIGRGRVQLPWADSASSNLTRLSKYLCTPQNIFNSWEGFLFQWTSHILNQKFFHFHFHKCHSPFHRYSKDNNLSGLNSPMNSFLRRFLSFSWGVEMTRQLMKARSTVLHIWKFFREALF